MKGADDLILCLELNPGQWKPSGDENLDEDCTAGASRCVRI